MILGDLSAEAGCGEGGQHTDDQDGHGGDAVGEAFDVGEIGHSASLQVSVVNPAGAGLSVWTLFR